MYNKNVRYESDYYLTRGNPMTMVIGINCGDSVIIATDSKASSENDNLKLLGVPKIFPEQINKNITLDIAGAGNPAYIDFFIEYIKKNYSNGINNLEKFKKLCIKSMEEILNEFYYEKIRKFKIPIDPYNQYVYSINFPLSIMISVLFNKELEIFSLSSALNIKSIRGYFPIGTSLGKGLTIYIFKQKYGIDLQSINAIDFNIAISSVLYIMERVKEYDDMCGGETQLSILTPNGYMDEGLLKARGFKGRKPSFKLIYEKEEKN